MKETPSSLCGACSSLNLCRKDFELPARIPRIRSDPIILSGRVGDLRKKLSQCQLCRLIFRALQLNQSRNPQMLQDEVEWQLKRFTSTIEYAHVSRALTRDQVGSALYPMLKVHLAGMFYGIQLIDGKNTRSLLRGRLVDDDPDMAMIHGWIKRCQSEHGKSCTKTYLHIHPLQGDLLVVDVEANCLTHLPSNKPYVALSYVLGGITKIETLISNGDQFRKPNGIPKHSLPKTISDAFDVTKALGYRYLWVDTLCIVQDDDIVKNLMIQTMDTVYGNAVITIVAATGKNANAGLSGWHRSSRKSPREDIEVIQPDFQIGLLPFFENELQDSPYSRRGWTYQEEVLSSRCLVFLNGRIFFYCRGAIWREDIMAESEKVVATGKFSTGIARQWARPFERLSEHIFMYSSRQLTYLSDIDKAFNGICRAMAPLMEGTTFLQGLPTKAFDWALLWGAFPGHSVTKRPALPSWGWMGHIGRVIVPETFSGTRVQEWLQEKTWINWCHNSDGTTKSIWQSPQEQDSSSSERCLDEVAHVDEEKIARPKAQSAAEHNADSDTAYNLKKPTSHYCCEGRPVPGLGIPTSLHQDALVIPSILNGCLDFMTYSCSYYLSQPLLPNAAELYTSNCFVLKDSRQETCGVCHDDHNLFSSGWASEGTVCEIILISYALGASRDKGAYQFAPLEIPDRYRIHGSDGNVADNAIVVEDDEDTQWASRDMFNVMLIRPHATNRHIYERIGIGVLHETAVKYSLKPVYYKRVILY